LIKERLDHQRFFFAWRSELSFESGALPLFGEMLGNIPSDQIESALQAIQFVAGGELPLEVGFLLGR